MGMKTISLRLEEDLNSALEEVCAEKGRDKNEILADVLRRYVEAERLRRALSNPDFARLYGELAQEDSQLAEEGLADYRQILGQADRA